MNAEKTSTVGTLLPSSALCMTPFVILSFLTFRSIPRYVSIVSDVTSPPGCMPLADLKLKLGLSLNLSHVPSLPPAALAMFSAACFSLTLNPSCVAPLHVQASPLPAFAHCDTRSCDACTISSSAPSSRSVSTLSRTSTTPPGPSFFDSPWSSAPPLCCARCCFFGYHDGDLADRLPASRHPSAALLRLADHLLHRRHLSLLILLRLQRRYSLSSSVMSPLTRPDTVSCSATVFGLPALDRRSRSP